MILFWRIDRKNSWPYSWSLHYQYRLIFHRYYHMLPLWGRLLWERLNCIFTCLLLPSILRQFHIFRIYAVYLWSFWWNFFGFQKLPRPWHFLLENRINRSTRIKSVIRTSELKLRTIGFLWEPVKDSIEFKKEMERILILIGSSTTSEKNNQIRSHWLILNIIWNWVRKSASNDICTNNLFCRRSFESPAGNQSKVLSHPLFSLMKYLKTLKSASSYLETCVEYLACAAS